MSSLDLSIDSPEAKQLQDIVQKEIARRGWSEGEEDAVMSEYVLVMVANKKTQQQIESELKDLLGEDQQNAEAGVESFVSWLWQEASKILGLNVEPQIQHEKNVVDMKFRSRRSASPENRASGSRYEDRRSATHNHDRQQSDRWQAGQDNKPTRELFPPKSDPNSEVGMAADRMDEGENDREGQRSLRIAGRGRGNKQNSMFKRSLEQAHRSNGAQGQSIFARAGVPNPRAEEFVPASAPQPITTQPSDPSQNLLFRIDPMMPNNAAAPASNGNNEDSNAPADFPTQPLDAALCRWGLKCTSPTCIYSHPSPSAVTLSRQTGEDPIVLRQEPCHYQKDCTRADCDFSHISPAVKFVLAKADRAASMAFGNATTTSQPKTTLDSALTSGSNDNDPSSIPCRYGSACYRQGCHFSHPANRTNHVSERLKQFANVEPENEMEVIIPTA
ncbi:uncharacterized protein FA14DRAFT_161412 [Meira miltonrushii]|uniref:C3H1-type domain-containing protein n=1 Tax=Meira miltonrushii TaxID=1280837 RepID=A0A316V876_9BASI|nr:uncharacterized protein FA14DRAFT_161412 [Meira miltonrushii]PWN33680.1 hypothetical protein FA14DRAFT_161412 [Meira miltonrushii]